jgi:DNA repair exonuclease SbcCD ATPase subunit
MINLLNPSIKKFTHILHVADIHIRLNKRHEEYRAVFAKLYEEARKTPETTVIAVLGDVFHSKSDLSPECVQMASDLFKNLAEIRPVIMIAGNHDATLSNKNRLDCLTPIVDTLRHPNLFYLRNNGLYGFGNILFNNMGVFDPPEAYIRGNTIPEIYRNQYDRIIALFHGAVDKAALDTGFSISNPAVMTPLFDNHHIALLGDIHKKQDLQNYDPDNNKPCVHYVGSLVQQNHGESLHNHGYSLWDLSTCTYEFHEIPNEVGYFTIDIDKGQITTDLTELPKKVHLRLRCYETIASEVKAIVAKLKEKVQIVETAYVRMDQEAEKKDIIPICQDLVLTDVTSVEYQNKLIQEFLEKKLTIDNPAKIDAILELNRNTNKLIKRDDFIRNLKWTPIRFEWDNMFTYGEGNHIDFSNMDGVYGIFGPNRAGKSSILSAILFCLFDKFDRSSKGLHVLNVQKTSFRCKLEFEISGVRYFVERRGAITRTGNVKVDVKFWRIMNGVEEELHGTARRDTNEVIRDYVGTYDDFILTSASFQSAKNNVSFIDMGHSERKDLLVQFIGLNVFDRLHEAANERQKELNTLLKVHKDKNYQYEKQQNENALAHADTLLAQLTAAVDSLKKQSTDVNEQIVLETVNLIKLDIEVPSNITQLMERKKAGEEAVTSKKTALEGFRKLTADKEVTLSDFNDKIQKIESSNLVEGHKTHKQLSDKITDLKQKIDLKKVEIKGKLEKAARLDKHEYDPNCKYCTNNSFVKDATKAKKELNEDKKDTDKMLQTLEDLNVEFAKFKWVEQAYETYTKLLTDRSKLKDEIAVVARNTIVATNELEKLEAALKITNNQIDLYHRNDVAVDNNTKIQSKISAYRNTLTKLDIDLQRQTRAMMDVSGKRELFKTQILKLTELIDELVKLEDEQDNHALYLQSVGRDGIPYQVICNTVPAIEREVNSILAHVVDYTIQLETDGKNVIPYVVYDFGRWPIELTSGFERFVASIAIRVAMTNVSNLPKPTFLAIDEGFGALDPEHLSAMYSLFSFLKSNFDFILVISHLDALKDAVDKQIDIRKDGNFSKVTFD